MDHGWMYTKRSLVAFVQGLELFVNVVSAYMEHNVEVLCFINFPCRDCKNLKQWDSMELIRGHLLQRGFMPNYMVWMKHGKKVRTHLTNKLQRVYGITTGIQM